MNKLGRGPPRNWNSAKEVFEIIGSNPRSLEAGQFLSVRPSVELTCNDHRRAISDPWTTF